MTFSLILMRMYRGKANSSPRRLAVGRLALQYKKGCAENRTGVNGLPAKSPLYTEKVLGHPLFVAVSNDLLTTRTSTWIGNKQEHYVSPPYLNSTSVLAIGPGARA